MKIRNYYNILDVGLSLESDSDEFIELFDRNYLHFRCAGAPERVGIEAVFAACASPDGSHLRINGTPVPIDGRLDPVDRAYQTLCRSMTRASKEFMILHAAVVAAGADAVAIAGPSGAGKTTIALKLLRRGFRLMSDDFCPIHRQTLRIHPYPRSVWVSQNEVNASPSGKGPHGAGPHRDKTPLRIDSLGAPVVDHTCRFKSLIWLDTQNDCPYSLESGIRIQVAHGAEGHVLGAFSKIPGARIEPVNCNKREYLIRYLAENGATKTVREILAAYEGCIRLAYRPIEPPTDYSTEPRIIPISPHEAALLVIRELKQDFVGPEAGDFSSRPPGAVLLELTDMLKDTRCGRLTIGNLETQIELIMSTLH